MSDLELIRRQVDIWAPCFMSTPTRRVAPAGDHVDFEKNGYTLRAFRDGRRMEMLCGNGRFEAWDPG